MGAEHLKIITSNPGFERPLPDGAVPLVEQSMAFVKQLDPQLARAMKESRIAGTLPESTDENNNPYAYFDSWLEGKGRGELVDSSEGLSQDSAFKTQKWLVTTSLMKPGDPRVLLRFAYVDRKMNEGYAYFLCEPENLNVTSAASFRSKGVGADKSWRPTDGAAAMSPDEYMHLLLDNSVRTLDIAAYCIDFPSPHGGQTQGVGELPVQEMLLQKAA